MPKAVAGNASNMEDIQTKVVFTYVLRRKPHMPPQWRCASQIGPTFNLSRSRTRRHELWPASIQTRGPSLPCKWSPLPVLTVGLLVVTVYRTISEYKVMQYRE